MRIIIQGIIFLPFLPYKFRDVENLVDSLQETWRMCTRFLSW